MKKIMFNDKYGLTQAVLEGRKTMTRQIVPQSVLDHYLYEAEDPTIIDAAKYEIGEVVAVAQAYAELFPNADFRMVGDEFMTESAGWKNKMFVRADLMPHHIEITEVKVERLQDISEDDCLKEGVQQCGDPFHEDRVRDFGYVGATKHYLSAKAAFAKLIDKVSGKGTWKRNPLVYVYDFKLIK